MTIISCAIQYNCTKIQFLQFTILKFCNLQEVKQNPLLFICFIHSRWLPLNSSPLICSLLLSHLGLLLSRPACQPSLFFHLYFSFGLISVLPGESLQFSRAAPQHLPKAHRCNKTCLFIWWHSGL